MTIRQLNNLLAVSSPVSLNSDPTIQNFIRRVGEMKYGYKLTDLDEIVGVMDDTTKEIRIFDRPYIFENTSYERGTCYLTVDVSRFEDWDTENPIYLDVAPTHVKMTVKGTNPKTGKAFSDVIEVLNDPQTIKDVVSRELGDDKRFIPKSHIPYGGFYVSKSKQWRIDVEFLSF